MPAILEGTTEVKAEGSRLDQFLAINGELRRKNNATIASFAAKTSPELLFRAEVFHPFTNTAVESAFADQRTYVYRGKEVDHQVHLGFDLASYTGTPIVAAASGTVLAASELGIYGNCVIVDHGMGVQSLYAHLSSIGVAPGAKVEKEQELGRSGMTGLAGGDHLHFTMLINGQMVNPVEWWDQHWIDDRILRKLRSASGASILGGAGALRAAVADLSQRREMAVQLTEGEREAPDLDHVTVGQRGRCRDLHTVHDRAVLRSEVFDDYRGRGDDDAGMLSRDAGAGEDDQASQIASDEVLADRAAPSVHRSSAGGRRILRRPETRSCP